jgi:hypothetical protein
MASRLGLGGGGYGGRRDIMVLEAAGEKPETRDWGAVATIYSISSCQTAFSFVVALLCRLCIYGLESPEQQNAFGLYSMPEVVPRRLVSQCLDAVLQCGKRGIEPKFGYEW